MAGKLEAALEAHFNPELLLMKGARAPKPEAIAALRAWWLAGVTDLYNIISDAQPKTIQDVARIMVEVAEEITSMDNRDGIRDIQSRN